MLLPIVTHRAKQARPQLQAMSRVPRADRGHPCCSQRAKSLFLGRKVRGKLLRCYRHQSLGLQAHRLKSRVAELATLSKLTHAKVELMLCKLCWHVALRQLRQLRSRNGPVQSSRQALEMAMLHHCQMSL